MLALERGHQSRSGVPGGGSTDDAAGSGSEGQQGSAWCLGEHLQVAQSGQEGHGVLRECAGDDKVQLRPLASTILAFW